MTQYEFANRLKRLIMHRECVLTSREASIGKLYARHLKATNILKSTNFQHVQALSVCDKKFDKMRHANEEMIALQDQSKQRLTQMRGDLNKRREEQAARRNMLQQRCDSIRNLKQSTGLFINLHALPEQINCVALHEKEHSTQLLPLCIDPACDSQQQTMRAIWEKSQNDSVYSEQWENLFFDCFPRNDPAQPTEKMQH